MFIAGHLNWPGTFSVLVWIVERRCASSRTGTVCPCPSDLRRYECKAAYFLALASMACALIRYRKLAN
ncbi:hypothetical protein ABZV24_36385 [Streptomyces sp. NPDC005251]|uniref:hypothetical protein n=1 Tax=Streptomyces sp. NPDC005251 TaxID=3157166 RepID=UPI0033B8129E